MRSNARSRGIAAVFACLFLLCGSNAAHAGDGFLLGFRGYKQTINTGGSITLSIPSAIVVDPAGDIFIADTVGGAGRIVEVNAAGGASVLTIGTALGYLAGMAIDGAGNLYIVDNGNKQIVKVSSSGGAGSVVSTGAVTLTSPQGVAVDQAGDVFISDGTGGSSQIVEVTSGGTASALSITVSSGPAALSSPEGLAVDTSGNLYITDSAQSRIVKVAAGSTAGTVVSINGGLTLSSPADVAVDRTGNIFICDQQGDYARIIGVDTSGNGYLLSPTLNTLSSAAAGVALDVFGTVYIADTGNSQALVVDPLLTTDSNAGALYSSSVDRSAVGFGHIQLGASTPVTITLPFTTGDSSGLGGVNVFTSGTPGLDFQIVSGDGTTCSSSTLSGSSCTVEVSFLPTAPGLRTGAVVLYDPDMNPIVTLPLYGWGDAAVAALAPNLGAVVSTGAVPLVFPFQIALDGMGNIYDANDGGGAGNLVKIPAGGGSASVVAPNGLSFGGEIDGVALDGAGNLFVSDHQNNRIAVITPGGVASALTINGLGAPLSEPTALAFDAAGNLYISDYGNGRIVEVTSLLVFGSTSSGIGTVIGTPGYTTTSLGITGVAVDSMGNIYIPDGYSQSADPSRVIKVTAAGAASLLTPTGITFSSPAGVGVDGMGNIYIADAGNNRIVEITTAGVASVAAIGGLPAPAALSFPFGVTVDPLGNLYIPDSLNSRILFVNVSGSALTFPTTAKGATSAAKTSTVTNLGNLPLIFSANPTYTANFSNNSGDTNPCTSLTSLLAGTNCDVSVQFTPQSVGSLSAGITVTNNALNIAGATEQVSVSGTSFNPGDTTSTAVTINPTALVRGQAATITATITDTTAGHTATVPTGSVTFTDMVGSTLTTLNNGTAVTISAGKAILSNVVLAGVGAHTITANYGGVNGTYLTSSNTTSATLSKATVTVTGPAQQPVAVTNGQAGSATITVTAPYTTISAPSGTVSYSILNASSTSVASGSPALTAGSGNSTASVPIPNTLAAGNYTISVTYSGDGNYLASATATTIQLRIGQLTPTLGWTPGASSIAYLTSLAGLLNASATFNSNAVAGAFVYTATPSGGTASTVTSASVLSAGSYTLGVTFTPTDAVTYQTVTGTAALTVTKDAPTVAWTPSTSTIAYGTTLTGILDASASFNSNSVAGAFVYTATPTGGTASTVTTASVLAAGSYALSVTFTPTDTTDYQTVTGTAALTVTKDTPTIAWTPGASTIAYGATLTGILNASASFNSNAVAGAFVYTATPTGGAASTVTSASVLAAGSYTLSVTFTPTDTTDYQSTTAQVMLAVKQTTPSIALVSSLNPVLITNAITFTATASSPAGTPTGSVSFLDGTTLLGSVTLSSGTASYTTSALVAATHSITAVYSGDANFASATSAAVAELVQDYSLTISGDNGGGSGGGSGGGGSGPTQTAVPGGTATYALALGPSNGATFPAPVTLTLSGLPPGATGTLTPSTLPAGSSLTNVTLSIQLPQVTASLDRNQPLQPTNRQLPTVLWGILLLPFARRLRRASKRLRKGLSLLLLLAAGAAAVAGMSGCGSTNGYFGQSQQTYTVTITATSGNVSRSTTVSLTVE
jgi:sugar lactone lactonase YvrE